MLDLSKLSPAHQNLFSQLESIGYPPEQAFANAMLWQARAKAGIARWNAENPSQPMTMEDWLQRYPLTVTSSIPQGQPDRTLHQFAGPQAQTADTSSLATAFAMERKGLSPDSILAETGWFRGLDSQWRFEIDDSQARFRGYDYAKDEPEVTSSEPDVYETWTDEAADTQRGVALPLALDHPKLFAAYPMLRYVRLKVVPRRMDGACLHEDLMMGGFVVEIGDPYSYPQGEALKAVMHEIQHAIQVLEGFARGGNSDDLSLPTGHELGLAINAEYRRRADEIEASAAYQALLEDALSQLPPEAWINPRSGARDERVARNRAANLIYESSGLEALETERLARVDQALTHVGALGQGLDSRYAGYRHLAGEAEARNTAARSGLSEQERREIAPWATLDIDPRDALVRLEAVRRAAQRDEPLSVEGSDWPLIQELAAFQRLPDEQQFYDYERREALFDRLAALYKAAPWFKGVFLPLAHGWVGVTGSAKEAGLWQVSFFDSQMMPMSDTGAKSLDEALREAFGEARFDLVANSLVPASEEPADLTLSRSRVRAADGSLLKVFHGTSEVTVIPGDSVPGDPAAIEELKAMAARFGIAEYSSVWNVLDRLGRTGQRGRLGDTDEDAARAEFLHERSKARVEPSRNAIGFDAFLMPAGDMELGAHFGTRDQALMFGEPFEFYLDLRNPIRLPDLGNWHYSKVIQALRAAGVDIDPSEEARVEGARDHNVALRSLMLSKGYDGVVYRNEAEGFDDSYIALKPEAIFPADQVVKPELLPTETPAFRAWFAASAATVDGQPGGAPLVLYHGTDADIEVFEGREVTAWVSEDPSLASGYASELRSGLDEDESAPNVVPVFASVQKPLVLDVDMNDPAKSLGDTLASAGLLDKLRVIYDHADSVWEVVNNSEFMRAIKKLGYDGVRVRERGVWTWGVDGQSQLKSIFNSGSFSPDSPLILNQSAVAAPASALARWFDGSPVATPDGAPQVMYHGSKTPDGLTVFVPGGRDPSAQSGDLLGVASYFTSDPEEASLYAGEEGAVLPVYLSGRLLNLESPILPVDEAERLSAFAARVLLPADRARFSSLRKARFFTEDQVEEAKAFFEAERERWKAMDGVMERSKPEVDKQGDLFLVRYTDFESPVRILTSDDAEALFRSVGWGNLPALGYDGVMLTNSEGRRWVAMHRPDGNVKSAIGNNGQYNRYSPRILDQSAYHGSAAEFDRFDPAIRGGVGRSYGHGIYLTADRGIADRYRQAMARQRGWTGEVAAVIAARFAEDYPDALRAEGYSAEILATAEGGLIRLVEAYADPAFLAWADELAPKGRVYTAEIPEADQLLSWDLPIAEQPAAIRELLYAHSLHTVPLQPGFDLRGEFARDGEPTGADIYLYLEQAYGSAQKASEVLGTLGIKGLTYRNFGFGSRDFVVFSPEDAQIVPASEKSAALREWFGDSVLTESGAAGGEPMVFYHGTRPGVDFDVFKRKAGDGIYFTPDPLYAEGFTNALFDSDPGRADGPALAGQIMPVYLRAERPFIVEAEDGSPEWEQFIYRGLDCSALEAQGYDAAVLKDAESGEIDQVIIFSAEQIKSAIGNSGAFDPASPNILNQSPAPTAEQWIGRSVLTKGGEPGGEPLVLYHGTASDFSEFRPSEHGEFGPGVYLSYREASARMWGGVAGGRGGEVAVVPVHVRMENPFRTSKLDLQEMALEEDADGEPIGMQEVHRRLREQGYDGIIGVGLTESDVQVVAFDGDQVRRVEAAASPAPALGGDELVLVMSPAFEAWFKGTAVSDGGRPKKVYHGISHPDSDAPAIEAFDRLHMVKQGRRRAGQDTVGVWFTETLGLRGVEMYSGGGRIESGVIYPVYLSIKSPWQVSFNGMKRVANRLMGRDRHTKLDGEAVETLRAWMKENGIDGIQLLHDPRDGDEFAAQQVWIALEPEQIRTAITSDVRYVPAAQLQQAPVQAMDAFIDRALGNPAFRDWFAASQATVDGQPGSRPLVLFHGTQADVEAFDPDRQGETVSSDDVGFFFTNFAKEASLYATADWWRDDPQPNVMPVFLSLQNPKVLTCDPFEGPGIWYDNHGQDEARKALEEGYDGLIVRSTQPSMVMPNGEQIAMYVAFEPTQIKSALGNVGAFDRNDSRVLFQSAAPSVWVNPFQMEAWTTKAGLSPAAVEAIAKMGIGQRGKPEHLMVEAQMVMGGGVLQCVIEHVGDLTDRMSPRHGLQWGYEETVEKATTCLRKLRSSYGFAREHAENLGSNARYRGVPVEQHAAAVSAALENYAQAHAELEAPTRIHALARDAAVLLGHQDFTGAAEKLEALLEAIPTFDAYLSELVVAEPRLLNQAVVEAQEVERRDENLLRWFGNSQVVDAAGQPLRVYHGTDTPDIAVFEGLEIPGWFSASAEFASEKYTGRQFVADEGGEPAPNVIPVFLSMQNPLRLPFDMNDQMTKGEVYAKAGLPLVGPAARRADAQGEAWLYVNDIAFAKAAEAAGYDGVIVREEGVDTYGVFRAEQIKSAVGNNGEFSPASPRILDQSPAPVAEPQAANLVEVDELTAQEQEDLVTALLEGRSESFSAAAGESYTEESLRQELFGLVDPLMVRRLTLPLDAVSAAGRAFSESVAASYARLSTKAPAILVKREGDGWALVEGGHRHEAAVLRGDALIDVVDVTDILQMDWESYLAGESLPGMPLKSMAGSMPVVLAGTPDTSEVEDLRLWFGGSKVVGGDGLPLVVYHGTDSAFDVFDEAESVNGFWFSGDEGDASDYGQVVVKAYLSIKNPAYFERTAGDAGVNEAIARAKAAGFDGLIVTSPEDGDADGMYWPINYVAFRAEQIKSADVDLRAVMQSSRTASRDENLRRWFGDSKIVDAAGAPKVMYHKTYADFTVFDSERVGENDYGYAGAGFYFMPVPLQGFTYGDRTMPVYLSIQNPYVRTAASWNTDPLDPYQWIPANSARFGGDKQAASRAWTAMIREMGYDGFVDATTPDGEVVAFDSTQIKSAIGNSGDFDPSNPSILDQSPVLSGVSPALDVQMRAVRAWMGRSVITVDGTAGGEPLRVYHGSHVPGITEFEGGKTAYGIFFTPDPQTAGYYAVGDEAQVYEAFLKVERLADFDEPEVFERVMREAVDFTETRDADAVRAFAARLYREGFGKSEPVTRFFTEQDGFSDVDGADYTIEDLLSDNRIDSSEIDDLVEEIASEKVSEAYKEVAPAFSEELNSAREAYGTQQFYMEYQDDFMRAARALGYDGVVFSDPSSTGASVSYVVFSADQIMLAPESSAAVLDQAAWHGTPYQFDSFSLEHVGASEGAAAFGWGLYLTSAREVALWYSGALGLSGATVPQLFTIRGVQTVRGTPEQKAADLVNGLGLAKARKLARQWVKESRGVPSADGVRGADYFLAVLDVLQGLRSARDVQPAPGNLLQVQIPESDVLLDWDAPLHGQPAVVIRAIETLSKQFDVPSAATAGAWYSALARQVGSDKQASFYLRAEGVPGISYLDGASRGATGGSRNFVIFDEALLSVVGREQVAVRYQFAGKSAVGADLLALKLARRLARQGQAEADVLAETGWFRGVDGQWRFELDDSQAALRPEMVALLREGDEPMDVARVAAHVGDGGLWSISLVDRDGGSRLLPRVPADAVSLILPAHVIDSVRGGVGAAIDLVVGDRLLPAVSVEAGFRFAGVESLPLPAVLDYPELFAAYPALLESRIGLIEGVRSMTSEGGDILLGRDLILSRLLPVALHEIQHVIQTMEGFAPGGSPEMAFSSPAVNPLATRGGLRAAKAILHAKLDEIARPSSLEEYARDAWRVPEGQPIAEDIRAAYAEYVEGFARAAASGALNRPAQEAAAREWYRRLAGEMESRLVERRWRLSAEERRALLPADGLDVDPKDAIVLRYSASAACVADSVATASRLGAMIDDYLRVDTGLTAWFKQSVVDSASWSKGECEKISVDLVGWLVKRGCDARVIFAQGLRDGLDAGAASDWEMFRDRGGRSEHFWHAAVLCDGVVADLSGAQFGSRYAGVRLLSPADFHAEWESVRVAREGRSVDLRRLAADGTVALSAPDAAGVSLGGLALVHGLISRGALPANALREACVVLAADGRTAEANDLRMVSADALESFGWERRRPAGGLIVSMSTLLADCGGAFDHLAKELADWNPARYGLAAVRGGMTVTDLVRGMLARLQEGKGVDHDSALGLVLEAFDEAGVLAVEVQQGSHRVRVDLDFAADSFKQALLTTIDAPRAQIAIGQNLAFDIRLLAMADSSSFAHETGHAFLEILRDQARMTTAKDSQIRADWDAVSSWLGLQDLHPAAAIPEEAHERFARGFELYLRKGVAPSSELEGVFKLLADLLLQIYETLRSLFVRLPSDVEDVFDRMLAEQVREAAEMVDEPIPEDRNAIEI